MRVQSPLVTTTRPLPEWFDGSSEPADGRRPGSGLRVLADRRRPAEPGTALASLTSGRFERLVRRPDLAWHIVDEPSPGPTGGVAGGGDDSWTVDWPLATLLTAALVALTVVAGALIASARVRRP